MANGVAELRVVDENRDTLRKIESITPVCPALEGTIIKLGVLESNLERLSSSLEITNETLKRLTVAIEELSNAMRR